MIPNNKTRVVYLSREQMCFSAEAYPLLEMTLLEFQMLEMLGVVLRIGKVRAPLGSDTRSSAARRKLVRFRADNYTCCSCGASVKKVVLYSEHETAHLRFICDNDFWLTVDHIQRKREGGSLRFDNIETLCFKCNQARENVDVRLTA